MELQEHQGGVIPGRKWRKAAWGEEMACEKVRKSTCVQMWGIKNKLYYSEKTNIHYSILDFHMKTLLLIMLWLHFLITQEFFYIANIIAYFWHYQRKRKHFQDCALTNTRTYLYCYNLYKSSREIPQNNSKNLSAKIFFLFELQQANVQSVAWP